MKRVLLIGGNEYFVSALKSADIKYDQIMPQSVFFKIENGGHKAYTTDGEIDFSKYGYTVILSYYDGQFQRFLEANNIHALYNKMDAIDLSVNKYQTYAAFEKHGDIRIPKTLCFTKDQLLAQKYETVVRNEFGDGPYLIKMNNGTWGNGIFLCNDYSTIQKKAGTINCKKILVQEYISPNKRVDERHIVFNGDILLSGYRVAGEGNFLTNIHSGGHYVPFSTEADAETKKMCVAAAEAVGLVYAGVDVIRDEAGCPYVLEINSHPHPQIIKYLGFNFYCIIAEYIKKELCK